VFDHPQACYTQKTEERKIEQEITLKNTKLKMVFIMKSI